MASLTKRSASQNSLKYEFAEGAGATNGLFTLMAATMLADAAPGPLKEWIRKHYQEGSSTWAIEPMLSEISVNLLPQVDTGAPFANGPMGLSFNGSGGVNNVLISITDIAAGGSGGGIVEFRFNHTLVR